MLLAAGNSSTIYAKSDTSKTVYISAKELSLTKGQSAALSVKNSRKKVKWVSSNKKVVSVNGKGTVKALKKGTAIVTAAVGKKKYKCSVTVSDKKEKVLIVYFSTTGTTKSAAKKIQKETNGALIRLQPRKAYTKDYSKLLDVAMNEQESDHRPALATTMKNIKQYDTILLGFPIWHGKEPMLVRTFLEKHNIYISVMPPQSEDERLEKVILEDEYGKACFYMLPFIKPGMVRHFMPDEAAAGEQAVIQALLAKEDIDYTQRNIILSHQFYKNGSSMPQVCGSEQKPVSVGGTDAIDISVLKDFDYAALGHIHGAQPVGEEKSRYCGTPIKYSVSEAKHNKSITVVEAGDKKDGIHIRELPVTPLHDVLEFKGKLKDAIAMANEKNRQDYISITLTDDDIPEMVKDQLEAYFDNILEIIADNTRTRQILSEDVADFKELSPYEAFEAFFKETAGREMDGQESLLIQEIIEEAASKIS